MARLQAAGNACDVIGVEFYDRDADYVWAQCPDKLDRKITTLCRSSSAAGQRRANLARYKEWFKRYRPDVVAVPGWSEPLALAILSHAAQHSCATVLMSDSRAEDAPRRAPVEHIKRRLLNLYGAALVAGQPQRAYLEALGFERDLISLGYDVVDNEHFARGAARARANETNLRQALGLPDKYFLACGRLIPKKNMLGLVHAFFNYLNDAEQGRGYSLVIAGDGPLRHALEREIADRGMESQVQLRGHVCYDELPALYGLAAAFVMPSYTDQWGLVVNEAMACGLPVLVSENAGCAQDLVVPGRNGYTFPPACTERLSRLLGFLSKEAPLQQMGECSRRMIESWGPKRFAAGLLEASQNALGARRPRMSALDHAILSVLTLR